MPLRNPTDHPIHEHLISRWSPYAFDPNRPVPPDDLRALFEAARWSPSSFNEQPWRFIVGVRASDEETWNAILDCLLPGNQAWAKTAPVLMIAVARLRFTHNEQENRFAFFDTGQAVASLLFEATRRGLSAHQMGGFDAQKARTLFAIPDGFQPASAIALGYEGDPAQLEDAKIRERHTNPVRARRSLSESVFGRGAFGIAASLLTVTTQEK